jgi:hypothetical protein
MPARTGLGQQVPAAIRSAILTLGLMAMYVDDLEQVAEEGPWPKGQLAADRVADWYDGNTWIQVFYRDGRAIYKRMIVHSKLREWLYRLRGLAGW